MLTVEHVLLHKIMPTEKSIFCSHNQKVIPKKCSYYRTIFQQKEREKKRILNKNRKPAFALGDCTRGKLYLLNNIVTDKQLEIFR